MYRLGCTAILPVYANGALAAGGGMQSYSNGHVLTYMCDTDFASSSNPIMCTCDTSVGVNNPGWVCSPNDLANTCRRSEYHTFQISTLNDLLSNKKVPHARPTVRCGI